MAKREIERSVQPSLLDRLTDLEPRTTVDEKVGILESARRFKVGLQRDLEWLLNTRRTPALAPEQMEELSRSLYHYGLPSFSDSQEARALLLRRVEDAVATFEPRLRNVTISTVEAGKEGRRRELHFVVEGTLCMEPTPEQVVFDTVLHFSSGEYDVAGVRHAG
jgi:type VI secretion system protein ImpF